jgi:putative phosphoribosyl transferase
MRTNEAPLDRLVKITPMALAAELGIPPRPTGIVVMPCSAPSSSSHPGIRKIAAGLQDRGFATVQTELLTDVEIAHGYHTFDIGLLAERIRAITDWVREEAGLADLPVGYFGTGADAGAVLAAAAEQECPVSALALCFARPDLAHDALPLVRAPTLFITSDDEFELQLHRDALARCHCHRVIETIEGTSTHLYAPETAQHQIHFAGDWFTTHLR